MYDADGTNFESWCSEDLSYSSNRSVQPSTDTEMLMAGAQARQPHGFMYGMGAGARVQPGGTTLRQDTGEAAAEGAHPDYAPGVWHPYGLEQHALEQHALGNLTRSVQAFPTPAKETPPTAMLVTRGFTAEDFGELDDPYHEPDDGDKQQHMHHHNDHITQTRPYSITGLPERQDQRPAQHVNGAGSPAAEQQPFVTEQPDASNGFGIRLQHSIFRGLHDSRGELMRVLHSVVGGV
jgi:hypothetical protein